MNKKRIIEKQLELIGKNLANAESYVAKGNNIEVSSWFHLKDWNGQSGHPLWIKNHMIPITKKCRAKKEKALEIILNKEQKKFLKSQKRKITALFN
jgi:hypothetical protein